MTPWPSRITRVTLRVANLERSLTMFRDVLGFHARL